MLHRTHSASRLNLTIKAGLATVIFFSLSLSSPFLLCAAETIRHGGAQGRLITLQDGINMVLKDSRLVKITLSDNEMAYQDSLLARSALLPKVNLTALKTYNRYQNKMKFGDQAVSTSDKDPFSFGVDVYQTLFDFGKSLSNYRASKNLLKATSAHTESVKRVAVLEFIVSYFNLLEANKMIAVAEKEVASLSSYLSDMEHLYQQGIVVKNDLLPAKVRLADAKQKLIAARNQREVVAARLNNILALPLDENILVEDIQMPLSQMPEIESIWTVAETQRPEVAFYLDEIKASAESERAKAVENFPVFFADAGYSYNQNSYVVHENNISASLGAKMNLYDGGAVRAELERERVHQRQLKEQKDKIIEDIKFEVEDSYYSLKNACEKISVAAEAVGQADESVRFYRVKYTSGSATSTDVLEAITLQTKAQTNYYSADYELKRNYAKLNYSSGADLSEVYEKLRKESK